MNTQLPRRLAGPVGPLLCALLLATAGCSFSPGAARNAAPAGHVTVTTQASVLPGQGYAWVPLPASTAPEQDARQMQATKFAKNAGIIGGLMLVILGGGKAADGSK